MELEDLELHDRSDAELIGDLASINDTYEFEADPHLDHDRRRILAEAARRQLRILHVDDDWNA